MGRSSIARMFIDFIARDKTDAGTKSVTRGLKEIDKQADRTGASLGRVKVAIGAIAVAGAALVGAGVFVLKGWINDASDLSETISKTTVVFGDAANDVIKWSKQSEKAFGMSQQQALDYISTFGALGQAAGLGMEASANFGSELVQAAADLGSFWNTDPAQVAQDIKSGLAGESEPLRKYNIYITEAAVAQKALEMGLVGSNGEISEQNKILVRQKLIMEQLGPAAGDYARTQDGLANGTRTLTAYWKNATAWLGGKLTPAIARAVAYVNRMAQSVKDLVAGGMTPWNAIMATVDAAIMDLFGPKGVAVWDAFTSGVEDAIHGATIAIDGIRSAVAYAWDQMQPVITLMAEHWDIVEPALKGAAIAIGLVTAALIAANIVMAITAVLLSPVTLALLAIAAVGAVVAVAWTKNWGDIQGKTQKAITYIRPALEWLQEQLERFYRYLTGNSAVANHLREVWGRVQKVFKDAAAMVKAIANGDWKTAIAQFGRVLVGSFSVIVGGIYTIVLGLWDVLGKVPWSDIGKAMLDLLWQGIVWTWDNAILPFLANIPGWAGQALEAGYNYLYNTGNYLIGGFGEGIGRAWNWLVSWVKDLPGAIVDYFEALYQSFYNAGAYLMNAVGQGMSAAWNAVVQWLYDQYNRLPGWMRGLVPGGGGGQSAGTAPTGNTETGEPWWTTGTTTTSTTGGLAPASMGSGGDWHVTVVETDNPEQSSRAVTRAISRSYAMG